MLQERYASTPDRLTVNPEVGRLRLLLVTVAVPEMVVDMTPIYGGKNSRPIVQLAKGASAWPSMQLPLPSATAKPCETAIEEISSGALPMFSSARFCGGNWPY